MSNRSAMDVLSTGICHRIKFTILSYYTGFVVARTSFKKKPQKNFSREDELKLSRAQNPSVFYITRNIVDKPWRSQVGQTGE
jgi:hypothetical protein